MPHASDPLCTILYLVVKTGAQGHCDIIIL